MTNKLVVIINCLKVQIIKKMLLYEMKFLVPNYSCLQNPWLGATAPRSPTLCPQLNPLKPPPPEKKIPGYATGFRKTLLSLRQHSSPPWRWRKQVFWNWPCVVSKLRFEVVFCLHLQGGHLGRWRTLLYWVHRNPRWGYWHNCSLYFSKGIWYV